MPQIFLSSSGFSPSLTSTSKPSVFLNTSSPSGASESVTRIFMTYSIAWFLLRGSRIEDRGSRDLPSSILHLWFLRECLHQDFLCRRDAPSEGNLGAKLSQRHF